MKNRVSLETAKLLKEKGFNLPCNYTWGVGNGMEVPVIGMYIDWNCISEVDLSAPTKSEVKDWLRDVKLVSVDLSCSCNKDGFTYVVSVSTIKGENEKQKTFDSRYLTDPKTSLAWPLVFTDYYEALEYGLVEGLKEI